MLGCALLAAVGVVVLTRPGPSTDHLGIGLGLLAALCWAAYILLNRTVGRRVPGAQGAAAAGAVSALVYVPVGAVTLLAHPPTPAAVACAAAAGLLSSAVPFLADLLALRRVPAHTFGIVMSVNPVLAAAVGATVLGEALAGLDVLTVGLIVVANAAVLATSAVSLPVLHLDDQHENGEADQDCGQEDRGCPVLENRVHLLFSPIEVASGSATHGRRAGAIRPVSERRYAVRTTCAGPNECDSHGESAVAVAGRTSSSADGTERATMWGCRTASSSPTTIAPSVSPSRGRWSWRATT